MSEAESAPRPNAARLDLSSALFWALGVVAAGAVLGVAWYAIDVVWSPLIVLPALVGGALGLIALALLEVVPTTSRAWAALALLLAALGASVAFHFANYQAARADFDEVRNKLIEKGGLAGAAMVQDAKLPASFPEYLRHEAETRGRKVAGFGREHTLVGNSVYAVWAAEAAIVFGVAYVLVGGAVRRTYCPLCRTWRVTIRTGQTTGAALASHTIETAGGPLPNDDRLLTYNVESCRCGAETSARYVWDDGKRHGREAIPMNDRASFLDRLDGRAPATPLSSTPPQSDATS